MIVNEYSSTNAPHPQDVKRPSIFQEINSIFQPIRLLRQYSNLTKDKVGKGQRIILFPGWNSHETVMFPMKTFLSKLGYAPEYWGLGTNQGKIEAYRDEIVDRLKGERSTDKITLIGWSLGGVVAREIARELPDRIASVVTYGTPIIGGPKYTIGAKAWGEKEAQRINTLMEELDQTNPIEVPITIIFTKNDSFVSWSACLDHTSKNVTHYEVQSTHLSLGIDPEVWKIVATHLQELENKQSHHEIFYATTH